MSKIEVCGLNVYYENGTVHALKGGEYRDRNE